MAAGQKNMDGGERENNPDVRLSDALVAMLEKLTGRLDTLAKNQEKNKADLEKQIQSMEHRIGARIDKIQHTVVGNGDPAALIVQLRDYQKALIGVEKELDKARKEREVIRGIAEENQAFKDAWRNRVLGIMIALPIITALLVIVLSHVLGIALSP